MSKQSSIERYEIHKKWTSGFTACFDAKPRSSNEDSHWLNGFDAAYSLRSKRNELLDDYYESLGMRKSMRIGTATDALRNPINP